MSARALWPLRRDEARAVLGSAALFTLAFPPFPFVVPALVCLVPIAVLVARAADAGGVRAAARLGFWFGFASYAASISWMAIALLHFTKLALLGYLATILAAGMLVALAATVLYAVRRVTCWPLAVLLPIVWVAFEVMMANLPEVAFPWLPLGLATASQPVLAQLADVSGVRGVSFVLAAVNGLFADAWLLRRSLRGVAWRAALAGSLLVGMLGYGAWRIASIASRELMSVAIVQPSVPQEQKWVRANRARILDGLASLTREVPSHGDADLVVWPEAALTDWIQLHPEWLDTVAVLVNETHTPLLFGALWREPRERPNGAGVSSSVATGPSHRAEEYALYNAALITDSNGRVVQPPYRKRNLVPIIERTPFVDPRRLAGLPYFGGYSRGSLAMFDHPLGTIGTLICYESIFGRRARELRREGADLLVNITNDAWFGRSLAPWQHEAHLVLRAIETRVGIVRAANTGFSAYVDPLGRVSGRTRLFEPAVRVGTVETTSLPSPYVRYGDWLGTLSAGAALAGLAVFGVARARQTVGASRQTPGLRRTSNPASSARRST